MSNNSLMSKISPEDELYSASWFSIICTSIILLLIGTIIYFISYDSYQASIPALIEKAHEIFVVGSFAPESLERNIFLILLVSAPFLLMALSWTYLKKRLSQSFPNWVKILFQVVFITILLLTLYYGDKYQLKLILGSKRYVVYFLSLVLSVPLYMRIIYPKKLSFYNNLLTAINIHFWLPTVFIGMFLVICIATNNTINHLSWMHFNAVFNSMVEVYHGKTLNVDFVNQYGNYPHFLLPIFKIIGLTTIKFIYVMTIITCFSTYLIYGILKNNLNNPVVLFMGFLGMMFIWFFGDRVSLIYWEPYFQYYSIRTLFPILFLYLVSRKYYLDRPLVYWTLNLLSIVSIIWNFETGVIVFCTWNATFMYEVISTKCKSLIFYHFFRHVLNIAFTALVVFATYFLYIYIRAGAFPDMLSIIEYSKIFYLYGYYMLPMPLIGEWNTVILIYLTGLAVSLHFLITKEQSHTAKTLFALSILGLGLFSYYQGRSHPATLTMSSYPAFIIAAILLDRLISAYNNNKITKTNQAHVKVFIFVGVFGLMIGTTGYIISIPTSYLKKVTSHLSSVIARKDGIVNKRTQFIKKHTKKNDVILILSYLHSSHYYLSNNLIKPINTPGVVEILKQQDYDLVLNFIKQNKKYRIIWENDFYNSLYASTLLPILEQHYVVQHATKDNNLRIFSAR